MEPGGKNRDPYVFPLEDRMIGLMTGAYYGTNTPPPEDMRTMDDVLDAYRAQLRFLMSSYRQGIEHDVEIEAEVNAGRLRFEDCFLRGTLQNAITWNNGGTKYHHVVVQGSGIATTADALYAIDKLVFQEKAVTLKQLNDLLKSNWEGQEALRQRVLHLPRFGNDIDEVDRYATWVSEAFADAVREQDQGRYLYGFLPTLSSDRDFTTMGRYVGATADGRSSATRSAKTSRQPRGRTSPASPRCSIPFQRCALTASPADR
jgi:formate C-acetyltransferase